MNINDYTYHKLENMINKNHIVVLNGGKDSSIVIMDEKDFANKFEEKARDEIRKGVYETSTDSTLNKFRKFQSFI